MMRCYECDFIDEETGDERVIAVELGDDEVAFINRLYDKRDFMVTIKEQALALRAAYRRAPKGYRHIFMGVHRIEAH